MLQTVWKLTAFSWACRKCDAEWRALLGRDALRCSYCQTLLTPKLIQNAGFDSLILSSMPAIILAKPRCRRKVHGTCQEPEHTKHD